VLTASFARRLCLVTLIVAGAGVGIGAVAAGEAQSEETLSWGVVPPPGYRAKNYHAPTPDHVPGARVITTAELRGLLEENPRPFLVDVLSGPAHPTLPGSVWLHNGGLGDFDAAEEKRFVDTVALIAGYDKGQQLVFYCSGARCWLSYNASLRAARAGFSNVYWYRGGIEAWRAAGLRTITSDNFQW